ncbi:MAG: ATP-binding protein, partial [Cellulosilyticum sp.]|nr:ATP-binding protein [Cellulosilyticum sp.]
KIFNRFYRSNEVRALGIEGSGIGLSLLKSLAYTMNIKIKVESEYGKGSSFILWIPKKMTNA